MNVDKLEVGFTNIVNVGRCAYFIYCNKNGIFISVDEIFEKCQSSHKVVITGDDPLLQKEDVARLCKKLVKVNPRISIEIFTSASLKPVELSGYNNNTIFNVLIYPKTDIRYKVDTILLGWFAEVGANFIFEVETKDDVDNAVMLMNGAGIKKSQTFLSPTKHINNLYRQVKFYGINLAPKVEWSDDDNEDE